MMARLKWTGFRKETQMETNDVERLLAKLEDIVLAQEQMKDVLEDMRERLEELEVDSSDGYHTFEV